MADLETTARELKETFLVDRGPLLKPGGRREVLDILMQLRKRGLNGWLILLPRNEPLEPWRAIWDKLTLRNDKDLLLLFNGKRWEARGWGLTPATVSRILDSSEADLRGYYGRGLITAFNRLADAAKPTPNSAPIGSTTPHSSTSRPATVVNTSETKSSSALWMTLGGMALVGAGAGVGIVIRRRMKRAQETDEAFTQALASARKSYADVMLSAENLTSQYPAANELQFKAIELGQQIEGIAVEVAKNSQLKAKPATLGRLQQTENELQALMTTILQQANTLKKQGGQYHAERQA
jgi:hypothetical protein